MFFTIPLDLYHKVRSCLKQTLFRKESYETLPSEIAFYVFDLILCKFLSRLSLSQW